MKVSLKSEVKLMEAEFTFGLRSGESDTLPEQLFETLIQTMKDKCPLLNDIFTTMIVGDKCDKSESYFEQRRHKTLDFSLKGAIQALACLVQIGNQETSSDMATLIGLLTISCGEGEKYVTLMDQIGITKSWSTM